MLSDGQRMGLFFIRGISSMNILCPVKRVSARFHKKVFIAELFYVDMLVTTNGCFDMIFIKDFMSLYIGKYLRIKIARKRHFNLIHEKGFKAYIEYCFNSLVKWLHIIPWCQLKQAFLLFTFMAHLNQPFLIYP